MSPSTAWHHYGLMERPCPHLPFLQLQLTALVMSTFKKYLKDRDIPLVMTSTIPVLDTSSIFPHL